MGKSGLVFQKQLQRNYIHPNPYLFLFMMMSCYGPKFRITCQFCGESTSHSPGKEPIMWSRDVFFVVCQNKLFNKSRVVGDLRRHNVTVKWCTRFGANIARNFNPSTGYLSTHAFKMVYSVHKNIYGPIPSHSPKRLTLKRKCCLGCDEWW